MSDSWIIIIDTHVGNVDDYIVDEFRNLWNLAETVKFGQNFEFFSKVWNLVKFLKFGKNF